tara:strand:- start:728 stop:1042 length:315 start_codon:yes stop_codon:yes gene_type:complete
MKLTTIAVLGVGLYLYMGRGKGGSKIPPLPVGVPAQTHAVIKAGKARIVNYFSIPDWDGCGVLQAWNLQSPSDGNAFVTLSDCGMVMDLGRIVKVGTNQTKVVS